MSELIRKTAAELAAAVTAGEVSATEVTQAHLDRIGAVDGEVKAFLHVAADDALAQAREVDRKRAAGEPLGALAGVPVAVKDLFATDRDADDLRVEDPRRLGSAVRVDDYAAAAQRRRRPHRQDQHGRVRDGLLHRELRVTGRRATRGT